jgi:Protein of unknown function (DUF3147)
MQEIIIRFVIGGVVVSLFSVIADLVRPKSFAGLFGAAPSIALATIGLTVRHDGTAYAAFEARSMILGAAGFLLYAALVSWILRRYRPAALLATMAAMPIWFLVSFGLWLLVGRMS